MSITAVEEEAVGVVALGQRDQASGDASLPEPLREALRCVLATAVGVRIKGHIDGSGTVAELPELLHIEMSSERAGDVFKAGLPQYGVVEQTFDENHFRKGLGLLP